MAIKRRYKIDAAFSMASMTDIVFLLLLFFMIVSTMSSPNDMKINLPQSSNKTTTKTPLIKVGIDQTGIYHVAMPGKSAQEVAFEQIEPMVTAAHNNDSTTCIALYADDATPYHNVIQLLDIANTNKIKIVLATNALDKQKK
ncbi:MAG: biopolymer transporter ExbD [Prevotellaceae bacterium]|jgi:biopolymer transport protein ExbD|nr:biopolymer transporter ExbD [Prevotellaceae bacterium]